MERTSWRAMWRVVAAVSAAVALAAGAAGCGGGGDADGGVRTTTATGEADQDGADSGAAGGAARDGSAAGGAAAKGGAAAEAAADGRTSGVAAASGAAAGAGKATPRPVLLGGRALDLISDGRALWALTCAERCGGRATTSRGWIVRIDPVDGRVLATARVRSPHSLAVGPSGVYLVDFWHDTIRRFDRRSLHETASVRLRLPYEVVEGDSAFVPLDAAADARSVWIATARGALARADAKLRSVTATVRVPTAKTGTVSLAAGAIWVSDGEAGVTRIDPSSGHVDARIPVGQADARVAVDHLLGDGETVVATGAAGVSTISAGVRRFAGIDIDSDTARSVGPLPLGLVPTTYRDGVLWAGRVGATQVIRANPANGAVVRRAVHGRVGRALAVAAGHLWTITSHGTVRTLRSTR